MSVPKPSPDLFKKSAPKPKRKRTRTHRVWAEEPRQPLTQQIDLTKKEK